jgi:hypothetical protein
MLRLYLSLVRFKLDYGNFVYGSATKSNLSIINPIHNTGIRLATGACRTSRLESLYAESGEPPVNLRWNLLPCGYVSNLATQPHHPSHGAIFRPILRNRYELYITASRPVGVRFRQLLRQLDIYLPHIIPYRLSRIPPWEITRPTCDLRLVRLVRGATSPLIYHRCFTELLSAYPDHTAVNTDGSFFHESTGSAFIYDGQMFSYRLHNFNSVFTAELYAKKPSSSVHPASTSAMPSNLHRLPECLAGSELLFT